MKRLIAATDGERRRVFQIVAAERGLDAVIIEKDFWVVWTLALLFNLPDGIGENLLFKGGTTLSKAYGVIRRFSEDIDLSLSRTFCGFVDGADPEMAVSNNQRRKRLDQITDSFPHIVAGRVLPALQEAIGQALKPSGWSLEITAPDTLSFAYPTVVPASRAYIQQAVKIELGGRSDDWPFESRDVTSFAAESRPQLFDNPSVNVRVLAIERTFWEKATILHDEYYRPGNKERGARISRHYSDFAQLASNDEIATRAIGDLSLLARVAEHKNIFYRNNWSRYDAATPGTLRLVPPDEAIASLRSDYAQMREMFYDLPPTFDQILEKLRIAENRINNIGSQMPPESLPVSADTNFTEDSRE